MLGAAREIAAAEGRTIGAALSMLARRGLQATTQVDRGVGGFPVFNLPGIGPTITSEGVRAALEDDP